MDKIMVLKDCGKAKCRIRIFWLHALPVLVTEI